MPSDAEWEILTISVGGYETAGKLLKATSGWNDYYENSGNGDDKFGFSALPGGYRRSSDFNGVGKLGYWWSSAGIVASLAYSRDMGYSFAGVPRYGNDKSNFFSVCVASKTK